MAGYISRITDHIFQSGQINDAEYRMIRDVHRFTHVLSANGPDNKWQKQLPEIFGEENVLVLPWQDDHEEKPLKDFAVMQQWYQQMVENPDWRVLVHCSAGINRSTICTMWLLLLGGMDDDAAYRLLIAGRPIAYGWNVPAYRRSVMRAYHELVEIPTMAKGKKNAKPKLAPKTPPAVPAPKSKPAKKK